MVVVGANYVSFVERMFVEVMLMCRSFTECVGEPSFWYLSLCKLILLGQLFLISDMTKAHPWPPHFRMIILIQAAKKKLKNDTTLGFRVVCLQQWQKLFAKKPVWSNYCLKTASAQPEQGSFLCEKPKPRSLALVRSAGFCFFTWVCLGRFPMNVAGRIDILVMEASMVVS